MQVLDKVFMSIILLAASFWDAAAPEQAQQATSRISSPSNPSVVVGLLDTLAHLQFCRMRLSAYSVLLQNLLQAAASSAEVVSVIWQIQQRHIFLLVWPVCSACSTLPARSCCSVWLSNRYAVEHTVGIVQASAGLLECLPSYEALKERLPNGEASWYANSVLASRMQFLMGILAPCIPQLPGVRLPCSATPVHLCVTQHPTVSCGRETASHSRTMATATWQEDMMGKDDR
jgi:hypothetical protein